VSINSNDHSKELNLKKSKLTFLAVATIFGALALTACTGTKTNTNTNSSTTSNTATDKPAASNSAGYSSPTATFRTFYDAAKSGNTDGIKRSMSAKTLDMMQKGAAKENKSIDEAFKEMVKDAPSAIPETRNEKIDGEKATLEVKDDKMDKWDTVPFVRENGEWKIAILDEMAGAMEKLDKLEKDGK
jgi:hypothetical protein